MDTYSSTTPNACNRNLNNLNHPNYSICKCESVNECFARQHTQTNASDAIYLVTSILIFLQSVMTCLITCLCLNATDPVCIKQYANSVVLGALRRCTTAIPTTAKVEQSLDLPVWTSNLKEQARGSPLSSHLESPPLPVLPCTCPAMQKRMSVRVVTPIGLHSELTMYRRWTLRFPKISSMSPNVDCSVSL